MRAILQLVTCVAGGIIGKTQPGGEYVCLFPAFETTGPDDIGVVLIGIDGRVETLSAQAIDAPGEDRV